jgi:hypothetical protein
VNEHFKDQLLVALLRDIEANPRSDIRPSRAPTRTLLAATIVMALVAGGLVLFGLDRSHHALVVTDDPGSTTTSTPDAGIERGFVFDTPHGRTYRVLDSRMNDLMGSTPPEAPKGTVTFRLAGADPRLQPMTVTPSKDTFRTHVVEIIGGRQIRTPDGLTFPAGMTEATNTGPWMWTEADGTQFLAMGLLTDLRRALPDLSYANGALILGASLVAVAPPPVTIPKEILRIRDEQFELGVTDDRTSTFDLVDPRAGQLQLVDVNGHQGVVSTGSSISWRVDPNTILSIQQSLAALGRPAPTVDELVEAARSIRRATPADIVALPVWRGALVERVVVTIPADLPVTMKVGPSGSTSLSVEVDDLDDSGPSGSYSASGDDTWSRYGLAIPLGADRVGHHLRLTLQPAEPHGGPAPAGQRGCPKTVTVPPEDAEPITVHLDADC